MKLVLAWFFKSRKAVTAMTLVVLCGVVAVIGYTQDDLELVKVALVTAAGVGGTLIYAVAKEDAALADASISEAQEQAFIDAFSKALRGMGLDEAMIAALRSLADAMITSKEEAAEEPQAWPRAAKAGNSGPLPPLGVGDAGPQYPLAG